jgi:hypothetical protein
MLLRLVPCRLLAASALTIVRIGRGHRPRSAAPASRSAIGRPAFLLDETAIAKPTSAAGAESRQK